MNSPEQASLQSPNLYRVIRAEPDELRKVLRLTLSVPHQTGFALEEQVSGFIEYGRAMRLDLTRNWWCCRGDTTVTACTCVESAGRSAMVMVPYGGTQDGHKAAFEVLMGPVLREEQARGMRLLQCLVRIDDDQSGDLLANLAFHRVAELIYLERDNHSPCNDLLRSNSQGSHLEWVCYDASRHQLFANTIELTYDGSLDCRGLTGLRQIDDIIAAHKGAGLFDPQRWLVLLVNGAPAGCILLAENPLDHHAEVAYMGVCPHFRRRGLGHLLMHRAMQLAHHAGLPKVTLAVDAANEPARKVYESLNFTETTRRVAWVHQLHSNPNGISR